MESIGGQPFLDELLLDPQDSLGFELVITMSEIRQEKRKGFLYTNTVYYDDV
jgi:hypothetical protein